MEREVAGIEKGEKCEGVTRKARNLRKKKRRKNNNNNKKEWKRE